MPSYYIGPIAIDSNGTKWIGTNFNGLAAYNENGIPTFNINENYSTINELYAYPNPTHSTITIELPTQPLKNTTLTLSNTNGQQLFTQPITEPQTEIDISHMPTGIYIVKVWNDNEVIVRKVIKQ